MDYIEPQQLTGDEQVFPGKKEQSVAFACPMCSERLLAQENTVNGVNAILEPHFKNDCKRGPGNATNG